MPATGLYSQCPSIDAPHPLPWGSPEFLGLGLVVFASIILIENFGSPFMKSSQVITIFFLKKKKTSATVKYSPFFLGYFRL